MTVRNMLDFINQIAPFDTQEPFDNSGLLVGSPDQEIHGILFALDVTQRVLDEAVKKGANLIVTHHPLFFDGRKRMTDEDYEGRLLIRLIRENISLIACHTNLDKAAGGMNDTLAAVCALQDIRGEGFVRVGRLPEPMAASELKRYLEAALSTDVRLMGDGNKKVAWIGICTGAGGDEWQKAVLLGAEAFLSGEIKHHYALAMADAAIPAFECGHFATEEPGIFALADALQSAADQLQYKVDIFKSRVGGYAFPARLEPAVRSGSLI